MRHAEGGFCGGAKANHFGIGGKGFLRLGHEWLAQFLQVRITRQY